MFRVEGTPRSSMKYLTGLLQSGGHIHSGCDHRRVLQQSRQVFHGQKMYFLDLISQNPGCIEIQV